MGDTADVIVATIDVETLGVVPIRRRYERLGPRRYSVHALGPETGEHPGWDVTTTFDVDEYGLIHDLVDAYRRT